MERSDETLEASRPVGVRGLLAGIGSEMVVLCARCKCEIEKLPREKTRRGYAARVDWNLMLTATEEEPMFIPISTYDAPLMARNLAYRAATRLGIRISVARYTTGMKVWRVE